MEKLHIMSSYILLIIAFLGTVIANKENSETPGVIEHEINANFNDMEQCQAVCVDIFFMLPEDPLSMSACERGCRIFNILYLSDDRSLNMSKDECYSSCQEAYDDADLKSACQKGCKNMLRKKQSELEAVIVYVEQNAKSFDSPQVELEELEMNWFIENYGSTMQLRYEGESDYKIPESMYRTLPIETLIEGLSRQTNSKPTGDWLDCASRNSGIPKWILVSAIVCAVLVALYLSISSEKKVIDDDMLVGDEKEHREDDATQAHKLPEKLPLDDEKMIGDITGKGNDMENLLEHQEHVKFSAPPKYTVESEMV